MKIGIGNDHVAVEYKNVIREYIEAKYGYQCGTVCSWFGKRRFLCGET